MCKERLEISGPPCLAPGDTALVSTEGSRDQGKGPSPGLGRRLLATTEPVPFYGLSGGGEGKKKRIRENRNEEREARILDVRLAGKVNTYQALNASTGLPNT